MTLLGQLTTNWMFREIVEKVFHWPKNAMRKNTLREMFSQQENQAHNQRYFEIKQRYFTESQCRLLADHLGMRQGVLFSVEEVIRFRPRISAKVYLLKLFNQFLQGNVNPVSVARHLDQYCQSHRPSFWNVMELWRFIRFQKFVEGFKLTCMREVILDNQDRVASQILSRGVGLPKKRPISADPQEASLFHRVASNSTNCECPKTVADYLRQHKAANSGLHL